MMDLCVGTYMCIIDPPEASRRRELYGKAGAFRPKSYGVEYRTPSNSWLTTPERHQTIYTLTAMAVYLLQNGITLEKMMLNEVDVQKAIDTGDYEICFTLLSVALRYGDYGGTRALVAQEYDKRVGKVSKANEKSKKKTQESVLDEVLPRFNRGLV